MVESFETDESRQSDLTAETDVQGVQLNNTLRTPELLSPEEGTNYDYEREIDLEWEAVSGADGYELEISEDATFVPYATEVYRTTETTYTTPQRKKDKTFFWRVRAYASKASSAFSEIRTFSTNRPEDDEVRKPVIESILPEFASVKCPEGSMDNVEQRIIVEYNDDKGDSPTHYDWRIYYYEPDGRREYWGDNFEEDGYGLDDEGSDERGCIIFIPSLPAGYRFRTFHVQLRVWNAGGITIGRTNFVVYRVAFEKETEYA
jgi:hypothetical protein